MRMMIDAAVSDSSEAVSIWGFHTISLQKILSNIAQQNPCLQPIPKPCAN